MANFNITYMKRLHRYLAAHTYTYKQILFMLYSSLNNIRLKSKIELKNCITQMTESLI